MANVTPRRGRKPKRPVITGDAPWAEADPTRTYALNVPIPEPLLVQLDYLVANRIVFSKASFIREVVAEAAADRIAQHQRLMKAVKRIEGRRRRRPTVA